MGRQHMRSLRFGVRGVSTTRGDTGTREAPPWLTVLWDSVTGFIGKRGLIVDEFLGRAEDLFPAVIWDWETACAKDFFWALRGKGGIPLGKSLVGGWKGSVAEG